MKRFIIFLIISALISIGLTFVLWPEPPISSDPIREQYAAVFTRFGLHAEDAYRQFDDTFGLDILASYDSEGLRLLLQYHDLMSQLQAHVDADTLVSLCRTDADALTTFLQTFQPELVADLYQQFGLDGLQFALDDPARVFLLQAYGQSLVELARMKGPIMFDLVRVYSPEFLELYYDDALFNAIRLAGIEGLLAMQTYRGMAGAIFTYFGQEPLLAHALRTYGYQQVMPVLYHVYQAQEPLALQERLMGSEATDAAQSSDPAERQYDNVHQALEQINRKGQTFLRQFALAPDGTVTRLPVVAFANVVEDLMLGDAQALTLPTRDAAESVDSVDSAASDCDRLYAVLDLLGLLPGEIRLTKYATCDYVTVGLSTVMSPAGLEGLRALDQEGALVEQYGPDIVPFAAQYGLDGVRLVHDTDGAILSVAAKYGPELVDYALLYGPEALTGVDEFGPDAWNAIRATRGAIIPYILSYGENIFHVLRYPDGQALIGLAAVFGEEIFNDVLQYPDDFPHLLFEYGHTTLTALKRYKGEIIANARQYGDDAVFYAGRYGDPAFDLIKRGNPGVILLRALPDAKLHDDRFLSKSFPMLLVNLLFTSPRTVHVYVGQLGSHYIPVDARSLQLAFWMLGSLLSLFVAGWMYDVFRRVFWIA